MEVGSCHLPLRHSRGVWHTLSTSPSLCFLWRGPRSLCFPSLTSFPMSPPHASLMGGGGSTTRPSSSHTCSNACFGQLRGESLPDHRHSDGPFPTLLIILSVLFAMIRRCLPPFTCWKVKPPIHTWMVFGGGASGRQLGLDELMKVGPMMALVHL